ncbi:PEP-utilizing enzyme [Clostridium oryzae]|uniref:Phosphoenolpyruvate synthase n=1 Tax=Clostridium oryzae TaxID=1450648 RepID=A0A1V4ILD9_9CLOT|nr:PEP-utilizing enzyme [Clostridium oryzae]OPJ60565.1 phosphoenolpyruvate synthase [Clostridium oryzae]
MFFGTVLVYTKHVENGSPFEHLDIIAREMNIPVICNVKNVMSLLKEGDEVILDGVNGKVTLINKIIE